MGQAKHRGTFEERVHQAISVGRVRPTTAAAAVPLLPEQWVVDGVSSSSRPTDDALYIKPILQSFKAAGPNPRQTLVLDNNILSDLLENRRPANNDYLVELLKSNPVEINPVFAMAEQRQKFAGAPQTMTAYRDFLSSNFGSHIADAKVHELNNSFERMKTELIGNIELLSGYLPQTVHLYHREDLSVKEKLLDLVNTIVTKDLPYFQIHFYYAALVFLARDKPELFDKEDLSKLKTDMKVAKTGEEQWTKIRNLSNDLAFLGLSLIHSGVASGSVYPYLATRDRMSQLLLSELTCTIVAPLLGGMANGSWIPEPGRRLDSFFGKSLLSMMPKRSQLTTVQHHETRSHNLRAVCDHYVQLTVDDKHAAAARGTNP